MLIKLATAWTDGDKSFPVGTILDVDDATALKLWQEAKADRYSEDAEPSVNEPTPVSMGKAQLDELVENAVEAAVEKSSAAKPITNADDADDVYFKTGGFQSMGHFCQEIFKAGPHGRSASERLKTWEGKAAGHLAEGDDSQGGYMVPTEFLARLLEKSQEAAIIRSRAQFIPMATNSISMPYVAESSRASTLFGGIVIYHPAEAAAKTATKPLFGKLTLTLKKLVGFVYASDELLEDSPISIEPMINRMFTKAISFTEEEEFINGTGVGQALGILNAGCLVSVAKETGQAAATIEYNNIVKMWSRLFSPSQANAIWMANMDTFPALAAMSLSVGTGGGAAYVPAGGLSGSPYSTLMGRPLFLTEHCQTLGTVGDIILCDWSQYLIGGKAGSPIKAASSMHFYFNYDEMAFRFVMRYDGQPWWQTALTPKHGSNTLSPFVALATRA